MFDCTFFNFGLLMRCDFFLHIKSVQLKSQLVFSVHVRSLKNVKEKINRSAMLAREFLIWKWLIFQIPYVPCRFLKIIQRQRQFTKLKNSGTNESRKPVTQIGERERDYFLSAIVKFSKQREKKLALGPSLGFM